MLSRKIKVKVDEDVVEIETKRKPYIVVNYNPNESGASLTIDIGPCHYRFGKSGNLIPPEDPEDPDLF